MSDIPDDVRKLAENYARRMANALLGTGAVPLVSILADAIMADRRSRDTAAEGMADHKWFDVNCQASGCQSLVLKNAAEQLMKAGNSLSFAAQTSGGTAGRDEGLVAAIDGWTQALAAYTGKGVE